jgi:polysaccharide pyruvyl transferase WcaK-like protein
MANKLKIGIAGPFSDINFGDYGMVVNNILDIGSEHSYTLFSYDTSFVDIIVRDYLYKFNITQHLVEPKWFQIANSLKERAVTPHEILFNSEARNVLRTLIAPLDIVLINGGGYFNELWAMPHRQDRLLSIMAVALVAEQLGKKVIFSANGYGPFNETEPFYANFFNSITSAVFYCRDDLYSPSTLRALGIDSAKIRQAPDDLHLLSPEVGQGRRLSFERPDSPYVILETYLPLDFISENRKSFVDFVKEMKSRHGVDTVFLPLNVGAGGGHQSQILASEIPELIWVDITERGYLPLEDARDIFANAALTLCSRYHALVFSAALGTPVLSVMRDVTGDSRYYYNKNSGFLRKALMGTQYDEYDYLDTDYLKAMRRVVEDFPKIVSIQKPQLEQGINRNREMLVASRKALLDNIRGEAEGK